MRVAVLVSWLAATRHTGKRRSMATGKRRSMATTSMHNMAPTLTTMANIPKLAAMSTVCAPSAMRVSGWAGVRVCRHDACVACVRARTRSVIRMQTLRSDRPLTSSLLHCACTRTVCGCVAFKAQTRTTSTQTYSICRRRTLPGCQNSGSQSEPVWINCPRTFIWN